jgi:hypothetical protein
MQKTEKPTQEPLQERLKEVTSKPKRRRMKDQIVSSTVETKGQMLREIRSLDLKAKERGDLPQPLVPVLFMWQTPQKRLSKEQASMYKKLGASVKYLSETEVKSLNIK